jgi:hypothetical protein
MISSGRRPLRLLLAAGGILSVALGIVGLAVPGMPTTVFLLIASALFARSSERLHRRLHAHPRLGALLDLGRTGMPLRAKVVAVSAMWTGIGVSLVRTVGSWPGLVPLLLVLGAVGTVSILLVRSPGSAPA